MKIVVHRKKLYLMAKDWSGFELPKYSVNIWVLAVLDASHQHLLSEYQGQERQRLKKKSRLYNRDKSKHLLESTINHERFQDMYLRSTTGRRQ